MTISEDTSSINEQMQALRAHYLVQVRQRQAELEKIISTVETLHAKERAALKVLAHKLVGSGKTFGFNQISQAARALENRLEDQAPLRKSDIFSDVVNLIQACEQAHVAEDHEEIGDNIKQESSSGTQHGASRTVPRLLLVDDDTDMHDLIKSLLCNEVQVITASNSTEAFNFLNKEVPDLILLDEQLPVGYSGSEMLQIIHATARFREVPIIMLTANDLPEQIIGGLAAGAIDYVVKPFDPSHLIEKIKCRLELSKTTVLIVDDDEPVRDFLAYKFKRIGCRVLLADNGAQALETMRTCHPNIVLLDRMMPGEEGLAIFQKMRKIENLKETAIVFLTAKHSEADIQEAIRLGASDYIVKPFNPDEVVMRCMQFFHQKKAATA